ncbi:MAG: Penicillin binding protein, partial [Pseudomonadota bacterium]
RAVRSPGSTLKPLIYGLAFDQGLAHPETLIEDRPSRFGTYQPKNFDHDWHGTVTIREALAQSLNIPAVKVLDAMGPVRLMSALESLGTAPELPKDTAPTLAIALGGLGMKLDELATAYVALARGGVPVKVSHLRDVSEGQGPTPALSQRPLMSSAAAWQISEILRHAPPPIAAKPGQIAFKTGTSYGHRDAWSVGYDGRHVIAVWVGRADGQSIPGLNGRGHAAPLLFDAFQRLAAERTPLPPRPQGVLVAKGDALPQPLRRFEKTDETPQPVAGFRDPPIAFQFPIDRAEIAIDQVQPKLTARVEGGALPLTWLVDGAPAPIDGQSRQATLEMPKAGFVRLTVIDAKGRTDHVRIRVRE